MRHSLLAALVLAACTTESVAEPSDDSSAEPPALAPTDPAAPQATPELATGEGWGNQAIEPQNGGFHIVFAFVPREPSGRPIDAVVGLSRGPARRFTDLGPIVRFSSAGTLDVRNGSAYEADAVVAYRTGQTYQVRMDIDMARRRYSVLVQEDGGRTMRLATDYAFRSEQAGLAIADNIGSFIDSPTGELQQIAVEVTPDSSAP